MSVTDKMIQYVAEYLFLSNNCGARWHDFRDVGMDEPYYEYYYAEDELYFIRDRVYQTVWATRARSPKEAFEKFRSMSQDLACGTMCGEVDSCNE